MKAFWKNIIDNHEHEINSLQLVSLKWRWIFLNVTSDSLKANAILIFHCRNKITTSLTYEELLPFIIDPSWIRLRKIAYTACWIAFFVILFTACIISFKSMSNTSCGKFPVTLTKIDNGMLPVYTDLGQDGAKGIISVVLSPFNVTATTWVK